MSSGLRMGAASARTVGVLLLVSTLLPLAFVALFEWPLYARVVAAPGGAFALSDRLLLAACVWSKTQLLAFAASVPALLCAARGARRAALVLQWLLLTALLAGLLLDVRTFGAFGLHLSELASLAGEEGPWQFAGGLRAWLTQVVVLVSAVAGGTAAACFLAARLARRLPAVAPRRAGILLALGAVLAWLPNACIFPLADPLAHHRLAWALPLDLRLSSRRCLRRSARSDPVLARLQAAVEERQADWTAARRAEPADETVLFTARDGPDVLVIVVESLRHDALEHMPRLRALAGRGLTLERHHAAGNNSAGGLFALLYGRLPLVYHAVLDQPVLPQLLVSLRAAGYGTHYFTGIPRRWLRMERFLNRPAFDEGTIDSRGDWPEWDRRALERLVELARASGEAAVFGLAYLQSTHYPYRYPPEFERHTPADLPLGSVFSRLRSHPGELRAPLWNRYRNTLAFLDELLATALAEVDLAETLVLVTGDHGESFFEDGRFGHGWQLNDPQTRVPLLLLGRSVKPGSIATATSHVDVVPTLLSILAGRPVKVAGTHGRDLLGAPLRDEVLLSSHRIRSREASLTAVVGDVRATFLVDPEAEHFFVTGLEDALGRPLAPDHVETAPLLDLMGRALR